MLMPLGTLRAFFDGLGSLPGALARGEALQAAA
jgi:hypothetical protein